jgi:NADH:ubiquinone oxidoreductase subunit C
MINLSNIVSFYRGWWFDRLTWGGFYYSKVFHSILRRYLYGFLIQGVKLHSYSNVYSFPIALTILKQNSLVRMSSLIDLFAVDYPNSRDGRFVIIYCFWSHIYSFRFLFKVFVPNFNWIFSISSFYSSAGWFEREIWDMFGVKFIFHPDLRRILTDYGFSGHPLRKDFPLVGYIELRYDDSFRTIVFEPVELSQELRFYSFDNPWNRWK